MNIVTKSGTNQFQGSGFTLFRDTWMNATTETEKLSNVDKQDYRRYQFGGSFGGPIVQNRAHFFAAAERTQQDRRRPSTPWPVPERGRNLHHAGPRELITGKATTNLNAAQYLAVRYGRNTNSQPYGAGRRRR